MRPRTLAALAAVLALPLTLLSTPATQAVAVTATASSTEGSGFEASQAADGDAATRWASEEGVDPQWIRLDLGATSTISGATLNWEAAYAKSYKIQTSPDGSAWTDVYSTTTGDGGTDQLALSGSGRYVRMYGTQRGTTYGYSLWEFTVQTSSGGDTTPPSTPGNLRSTGTTANTVSLAWNAATDNVGVTGYEVYRGNTLVNTVTGTTFTDTGLSASTSYTYTVKARDAAGNTSPASGAVTATTQQGGGTETLLSQGRPATASSTEGAGFEAAKAVDGDTAGTRWASEEGVDPQWIQVDLGTNATVSRVKLTWEAAYGQAYKIQTSANGTSWTDVHSTTTGDGGTDDVAVIGAGRFVRVHGTQRGTAYGYSLFELQVYGTPGSGGDTTPPSTPGNLRSTATTASSVSLAWNAATDNVGVTGYDVYRGSTLVNTATGTTFTDTGLTASTSYTYTVKARDAAGNTSPASNAVTATTQPPTSGGTPVEANGQLRVCGTKLCNENGKQIQLRGMSSHGLQWYSQCLNTASLDALATDWKADVLRISMYIQEDGYETNPRLFTDRVHNLIEQATARGMYAIVDWHMLTPGDPMYNLARAKTFFTEIAQRHNNKKNLFYEIANEPNGVSWSTVKSYAEQLIPVIRAIDSDTPILVGTRAWSSLGVSDGASETEVIGNPVNATNIMYTFHFYAASHGSNYFNTLSRAADRLPMFVTEFGTQTASGGGGNNFGMSQQYIDLMAQKKISWVNWNYSDDGLSGAVFTGGTCPNGPFTGTSRLKEAGVWIRERVRTPDDF
ncbi:cellulase family glycosylhydrolase [Nonomuraea endophytica]|uniref:cellulase n=1 Tax=Nonomuraea endophytica TaxID=714136 RepID=A0A7W8EG24_9ACTN|nr:cellulase family glycosylhydrolase [Nonomuraea endophytica]MBB5079405.1 chitodextrinase [Nonomuraea endophytica]